MQNYIVLDFETTGLEPQKDVIMEAAALKVKEGKIVDTLETFVDPEREITPVISSVTSITNEMLIGAPSLEDVISRLHQFCGDLPIIGHNVEFDRDFLRAAQADLPGPTIDTFFLSQTLLPESSSHSLNSLIKHLGLVHENAHRAMGDVQANQELFIALEKRALEINPEQREQMIVVMKKAKMFQYAKWLRQVSSSKTQGPRNKRQETSDKNQLAKSRLIKDTQKKLLEIWQKGERVIAENWQFTDIDWIQFLLEQGEKVIFIPRDIAFLSQIYQDDSQIYFWQESSFLLDQEKFSHLLERSKLTFDEARVAWKILASRDNFRKDLRLNTDKKRQQFRLGGAAEFRVWEQLAQTSVHNEVSNSQLLIISRKAFWSEEFCSQLTKTLTPRSTGGLRKFDKLVVADTPALLESFDPARRISLHSDLLAGTEGESVVQEFFVAASQLFTGTGKGKFPTAIVLNDQFRGKSTDQELQKLLTIFQKNVDSFDSRLAAQIANFKGQNSSGKIQVTGDKQQKDLDSPSLFSNLDLSTSNIHRPTRMAESEQASNIQNPVSKIQFVWVWPDGRLVFHSTPLEIQPLLLSLLEKFSQVTAGLPSRIGLPILQKLGGIAGESWSQLWSDEQPLAGIPVYLHHSDNEKHDDAFIQKGLQAAIEGWLKSEEQKLLILCNSVRLIEKNFLATEAWLREGKITLLGEGISGGYRRLLDELSRMKQGILFCRHEFLPERELQNPEWQTMILTKMTFDPPNQPMLQARSSLFDNNFEQSAVPRAALRLARSLPRHIQRVICLDHNLNKPWAEPILQAFGIQLIYKTAAELEVGELFYP